MGTTLLSKGALKSLFGTLGETGSNADGHQTLCHLPYAVHTKCHVHNFYFQSPCGLLYLWFPQLLISMGQERILGLLHYLIAPAVKQFAYSIKIWPSISWDPGQILPLGVPCIPIVFWHSSTVKTLLLNISCYSADMSFTIHVIHCQTHVDHVVNCHNFISMAVHTFINLATFRITFVVNTMCAFPNRTYTHNYG